MEFADQFIKNYPKWNSTIISIDGKIALGKKIQLKSYLDPKRIFKLTVKEVQLESRLVWGYAMGKREYEITPKANGQTNFSMTEKISSPLFPLFAKMIPPFNESFEKFANDKKKKLKKNNQLKQKTWLTKLEQKKNHLF